ncbi:MAG: DUF411 domain-containing protein [Polaromonas sp.]|nr:DUF411 domain-containing protein [Gemmatimonadaceae bacterium]
MIEIETECTRRTWLASVAGTLLGGLLIGTLRPTAAHAVGVAIPVTVYKDPSCGCCTKWVAHLASHGFSPTVKDRTDMVALKDSLGIPVSLRACHTAVAGRYMIEGHVPAADMKRLLATAPRTVLGLAVPDMPAGSPGMETTGRADRFDVIAFAQAGQSHVFASHG